MAGNKNASNPLVKPFPTRADVVHGVAMEWPRDLVLRLIDLYHANPTLWDPTNPNYKDRNKKNDAWKAISTEISVDRVDVVKKIETLVGQFRREVKKMKTKSGAGSDEVYKGNWFAFNSLNFLLDKMKPRETLDAGIKVSNMQNTTNIYYPLVLTSHMNIDTSYLIMYMKVYCIHTKINNIQQKYL